jgi:hypothetical protein
MKFISTKKETRHKYSTAQQKKEKGKQVWIPKNHCTYCNRGGDQKCWHVYRKSVLVIDGKKNNEPNLKRAEEEKDQKR